MFFYLESTTASKVSYASSQACTKANKHVSQLIQNLFQFILLMLPKTNFWREKVITWSNEKYLSNTLGYCVICVAICSRVLFRLISPLAVAALTAYVTLTLRRTLRHHRQSNITLRRRWRGNRQGTRNNTTLKSKSVVTLAILFRHITID